MLLVGFKPEDLGDAYVGPRVRQLGPVQEGMLTRDGRIIRRYYYRLAYDYRGASSER